MVEAQVQWHIRLILSNHSEERCNLEDIRGYVGNQIIRQASGSPATYWQFSDISHSVLIDNLGSIPIYFNFNGSVDVTNSGTGFIAASSFRAFDVQCGSISIQSSGATASNVQIVRLT